MVEIGKARCRVRQRTLQLLSNATEPSLKKSRPAPPRHSGECRPIGAFGARKRWEHPGRSHMRGRTGHRNHKGLCASAQRHPGACAVAGMAVQVHCRRAGQGLLANGFTGLSRIGMISRRICIVAMLVLMVAKMRYLRYLRYLRCCLMPAIGRSCRPDGLKRHEHQ